MKLFAYEGYEVRIAPEALLLKPFKRLWSRDKSKTKDQANMEFAFLYFFCDPRSDYQYIIDDEDRMAAVKDGIGFDASWKPDACLQAAIDFYKTFDSSASILLRTAAKGVKKVQDLLETLTPNDTKSLREYLTAMKLIPEVASMIKDAEKAINEEVEYGQAKGAVEKAMFDDGLDDVAEWVDNQR